MTKYSSSIFSIIIFSNISPSDSNHCCGSNGGGNDVKGSNDLQTFIQKVRSAYELKIKEKNLKIFKEPA